MINKTEQEIIQNWKGDINKPVVSICCGTYNHENYITDAIEGFLMQETSFPFEIIIRDDCSTDRTTSIIKQYVSQYPNLIKPILEKENQYSKGVKHLSVSIKKAVGKYIALCEGDDYWTDPLKLQKQVDVFENNSQISICFHPAEEINMLDNKSKIVCKHFLSDNEVPITDVILGRGGYMPTASLMFRNIQMDTLIDSFKDAPIGDYFLQVYMASLGDTYFLKDSMCVYRRNASGSWTDTQSEKHNWLTYCFKMVEGIDTFSPYLQKAEYRTTLYSVLQFYAKSYIVDAMGIRGKIKAINDTSKLLQNYNRNKYRVEMYLALIKNKLLGMIK